ncbi:MAG: hypothetical protein AB8I08_20115 [Sandaracinaceae bacterium]
MMRADLRPQPTTCALLVAALLSGCGPLGSLSSVVTIPHPSETPVASAATQVSLEDIHAENAFGMGRGVLVDRAALQEATAGRVCAQVAYWMHPIQPRASVDEVGFTLEAVDAAGQVRVVNETGRTPVGRWQVQRNGRASWRTGFQVPRVPIAYSASNLCFETPNLVTSATREVRLVTEGPRRVAFVWRFDRSATYPAGAADAVVHPEPDDPFVQARGMGGVGRPRAVGLAPSPAGGLTALPYPGAQPIPGGHPPDVNRLRALVEGRFELLRQCLSRTAEREPQLLRMQGVLTAEFTVGPSGVDNIRIVRNDFTPGAAECMSQHLRAMPIPVDPMRWTSLFQYGIHTGQAPR